LPILTNQLNQAMLAEFAEIIFRLGNSVAIGQKDLTTPQRDRILFVIDLAKQPNDGTATFQAA